MHEALDDVVEVYHLAALPGMWTRCKKDFHAVNYRGTEIVLEAARQRGVSRFLHCSTRSILFGASPLQSFPIDHVRRVHEMPGVYTLEIGRGTARFTKLRLPVPVVIANPTMPIGPHYGNLTPPTLMLRYFINRRVQLYFDFVLNLVDVRDVAAGLLLAMERGQSGHRYILGGEAISLGKVLVAVGAIIGRKALRVPIPAGIARTTAAIMELVSDHVTHRPPAGTVEGVRIALRSQPLSIEKSRRDLGYAPNPIGPALRETVASLLGRPGKLDKPVSSLVG